MEDHFLDIYVLTNFHQSLVPNLSGDDIFWSSWDIYSAFLCLILLVKSFRVFRKSAQAQSEFRDFAVL